MQTLYTISDPYIHLTSFHLSQIQPLGPTSVAHTMLCPNLLGQPPDTGLTKEILKKLIKEVPRSHCKITNNIKDQDSITLTKLFSPIEMFASDNYLDELQDTVFKKKRTKCVDQRIQ